MSWTSREDEGTQILRCGEDSGIKALGDQEASGRVSGVWVENTYV
jgi:hypothetical protein